MVSIQAFWRQSKWRVNWGVLHMPRNILHPPKLNTWSLSIGGLGRCLFFCPNSSCLGSTVPFFLGVVIIYHYESLFFSRLFLGESSIRTSSWNAWSNIWKQSGRPWVFGQRSKVELTKEMLQSLARNLAKIQYTPRKQTWEPQNWWFLDVFPFPRGCFRSNVCFQGCNSGWVGWGESFVLF